MDAWRVVPVLLGAGLVVSSAAFGAAEGQWFLRDRPMRIGPEVAVDLLSGLHWQARAPAAAMDWAAAGRYCDGLELAGRDDWRLPARVELLSLMHYHSTGPHHFPPAMVGEPPGTYWTGTVYDNMPSHVWIANFSLGDVYCLMRAAEARVRCVAA